MTAPPLPRPDNRLYLGRGGSGKTTLALDHAARFRRVVLVLPTDAETPPFPATRDRRELVTWMMRPSFALAFICDGSVDLWEWASEAAWRAGDTLAIWEEAAILNQGKPKLPPMASQLWFSGRHRRCRVFACAQRAARISNDVLANATRIVMFRTTEPNDLRYLRDTAGDPAMLDAVQRLDFERHEAVDWSLNGWAVKRAPFP